MSETYLTLSSIYLPKFSARNCSQILQPLKQNQAYRNINGQLISIDSGMHDKYKTVIKGTDQLPAALNSSWKGCHVQVGCIQQLWQKSEDLNDGAAELVNVTLDRTPVKQSIIAMDNNQQPVAIKSIEGRVVALEKPGLVGYRPLLDMVLTDFSFQTQEWSKEPCAWTLTLEEI